MVGRGQDKEEGWKRREGGASHGSDIFKKGRNSKAHHLLLVTFASPEGHTQAEGVWNRATHQTPDGARRSREIWSPNNTEAP